MTIRNMAKQLFILLLSVSLYSCSAQDCKNIPTIFSSYQQAKTLIRKSKFVFVDKVNTDKSSWVRSAKFYSCDGKTGFFIIVTDKQEYTHESLPVETWNNFKLANSFGQFYNQNIKNRYQLNIQN